jgi:hypothetical protein
MKQKKAAKQSVIVSVKHVPPKEIDTLKESVAEGLKALTTSLFEQARLEQSSLTRLSKGMNKLEELLLDDEVISDMDNYQRLALYKTLSSNQNEKIRFMLDLHKSATDKGLQVLDHITRLEKKEVKEEEVKLDTKSTGDDVMVKIQSMLQQKIKDKINTESK